MIRNLVILLILILFLIFGLTKYHFKSVENMELQPLSLYHYEDKSTIEKIDLIIKKANFLQVKNQKQNFGFTNSVHWFKFRLSSDLVPRNLSLDINNFGINELELFEIKDQKIVSLGLTGDRFPFEQRPIPTKTFVYQFNLDSNQSRDYYLKLDKHNEIFSTEINLWNTSDYENKEQRAYYLWGIFYGLGLLVIVLNLLFFYSTNDKVYLWFAVYIIGMLLGQMAESGLSFQYLWPNYPVFNQPEPIILAVWFYSAAVLQFQQEFLQIKHQNRLMFYLSQVLKYFYLSAFIIICCFQIFNKISVLTFIEQHIILVQSISVCFLLLVFIWVIKVGMYSKNRVLKLYSIGFSIQTILQFFLAIQNIMRNYNDGFHFIDSYKLLLIVFFIDLVIFSYLLAYRYRKSYEENVTLQIDLAENEQKLGSNIIKVLDKERNDVTETLQKEVGDKLRNALVFLKNSPNSSLKSDAEKMINKVNLDMESISSNVLPIELLGEGLAKKLSEIIENLNKTEKIIFQFNQIGEANAISFDQEIELYRIANELINNVLKHSKASKASISLIVEKSNLTLKMEDNGIGFTLGYTNGNSTGIGLKNIHARAEKINARVSILSKESGAIVSIYLPI